MKPIKQLPKKLKGKIETFLDGEHGGWEHHYKITGCSGVGMLEGSETRKSKPYRKIWHEAFPDQIFTNFGDLRKAIDEYNQSLVPEGDTKP